MYPAAGNLSGCVITLNDKPCCDVDSLYAYSVENNLPTDQWLHKVNHFVLPRGRHPGRGRVLMTWKDLKGLVTPGASASNWHGYPNSFDFTLRFKDSYGDVKIKKLGIVRCQAVTGLTGKRTDDTLFMVELADVRYIGRFTSIDAAYNYRSYRVIDEYDSQVWYDSTTNGGVPWTWSEIVDEVWENLQPTFGALTKNADFPSSSPENLVFRGVSAWDAICSIADAISHVLYRDLDGDWKFVSKGGVQTTVENATNKKATFLPTNDYGVGGLFPETIRVFFPSDRVAFQNDGDAESVAGQDAYRLHPLYDVDVSVSTLDANLRVVADAVVPLHGTQIARYDSIGNLLNSSELNAAANELAELWLASHDWDGYSLHTVYHGFHATFSPGEKTAAVAWYSTGEGSKTEVLLSPLHYEPQDTVGNLGRTYAEKLETSEFFMPPDLARMHEPTERFAVIELQDDIPCKDGYGDGIIQYGTASGYDVSWDSAGKTVVVYNPGIASYKENDKVCCFHHWQARRWVIVGPAGLSIFKAKLSERMCPNENALFEDGYNVTCCSQTIPNGSAINPFKLAGIQGDAVLMYYDSCDDAYVVFQVTHREQEFVKYPFTSEEGCEPEYDQYGYPTGNTIPTGECKITYQKRTVSVMSCDESTAVYVLYSFSTIDVLTDVYVSGYDIYGTYQPMYVACQCSPYNELLIQGTACTYGSGSGG